MSLGPVMLDIEGTELSADDIRRLQHPLVGGVILFQRNYISPAQLGALTMAIHRVRQPPLLIAVDHEGGRVQRFREGFTRIPAMRELGHIWDHNPKRAKSLAEQTGWVLAAELRAHGVDLSFTPVLDIDFGNSTVVGDRAFHRRPEAIVDLAHALMMGLKRGGMAAVGKHFPGHGYVTADSHTEIPVDKRTFDQIEEEDLQPFRRMIGFGLHALMPAHVIYPKVDTRPAGFSPVWLQQVLRGQLGFQGVIFSDDLAMEGATVAGGVTDRALAALHAGCDMVLVCNRPDLADELLGTLQWRMSALSMARLARMHGRPHAPTLTALHEDAEFIKAMHRVATIGIVEGNLPLD
ncbi:MAG: beta-N-acetylhexosaminidase [Methylophilaceae bacterium]|nr:beta-N-acetylhexosaminidase [Methylophilaceae bacterium]